MSYPKVMIHEGKHDNRHILIQSPDEEGPAWLAMFNAMDQWDQAYIGIEGDDLRAYTTAKTSEDLTRRQEAAKWLLQGRSGVEYEDVQLMHIDTPATMMEHFNA